MFAPPLDEQRFVLEHVTGLPELAASDRFAAATPDLVDAVIEGVGSFAEGEWAPLARASDQVGAKWTPEGVVMPEGFPAAYKAFVEGGWGTISAPEA
ncbi:acyl-CoA dehydrogenase N-terminal domain-containing protein, partial [Sphingomonas sp. Root1294]